VQLSSNEKNAEGERHSFIWRRPKPWMQREDYKAKERGGALLSDIVGIPCSQEAYDKAWSYNKLLGEMVNYSRFYAKGDNVYFTLNNVEYRVESYSTSASGETPVFVFKRPAQRNPLLYTAQELKEKIAQEQSKKSLPILDKTQ